MILLILSGFWEGGIHWRGFMVDGTEGIFDLLVDKPLILLVFLTHGTFILKHNCYLYELKGQYFNKIRQYIKSYRNPSVIFQKSNSKILEDQ